MQLSSWLKKKLPWQRLHEGLGFFFSKMLVVAWMKMIGKCWYWQRNQLVNNLASVFPAEPGKAKLGWKIHWQGFNYDFNNEAWTNLLVPVRQLAPHAVFPGLMEGPWESSLTAGERACWSCNFSQRYKCLTFWKNEIAYFAVFIWEPAIRFRQSVCHPKLFVAKTLFVLCSQKCHSVSGQS